MMTSPDIFYEHELKGKTPEKIAIKIRSLKREMGHLKKMIEHPDYNHMVKTCPGEDVRLYFTRLYLDRAIAAYQEAGGIYQLNKNEQRVAAFDKSIPMIKKIVFSIGGFFGGYTNYTLVIGKDCVRRWVAKSRCSSEPENRNVESEYPFTKEEFFKKFRDIHMGEWHKHYFEHMCDGMQWEITIEYADGRKVEYDGSNASPFSFDQFCELVECEESDDD